MHIPEIAWNVLYLQFWLKSVGSEGPDLLWKSALNNYCCNTSLICLQLLQKLLLIVISESKLCTYVYSSLHFRNIQGSIEIFADT